MPRNAVKEERAGSRPYLFSAVMVAAACMLGLAIDAWMQPPNISMVFLAAVLCSAIRYGLWPSLFASLLSTLLYNVLFLEPRYSLTIDDPSNVVALVFLLIVAVLTSELTARLKREAAAAKAHAEANAALYEFSGKIAGIGRLDDLVWAAAHQLAAMLDAAALILLPTGDKLGIAVSYPPEDRLSTGDQEAARLAWLDGKATGIDTALPGNAQWLFVPMKSARGSVGAIGLRRDHAAVKPMFSEADRRLIDALADQTAVAIERISLAQQMEQARLAAETERLRIALLSAISHDFRTPLAAIIGSASTLRSLWERFDRETRVGLLDTIREESERLNRFVGNVLEMTKLEAGKLAVNLEPVELADLISATMSEMARSVAHHRIALDAPPDLPLAKLDPVLCRQVFVNLIDNAAKFAPAGSQIDIRLRSTIRDVSAEIIDEGPGIPAEYMDTIFDRFVRVNTGDRRRAGTGLGLAICRGFVEAMSGTIAVRNRKERSGAVFTVTFPVASVPNLRDMEDALGDTGSSNIDRR
jgi:two-component system, OmpR family, sensor histidine kinase KdpD